MLPESVSSLIVSPRLLPSADLLSGGFEKSPRGAKPKGDGTCTFPPLTPWESPITGLVVPPKVLTPSNVDLGVVA